AGHLKKYLDNAEPSKGFSALPAANYDIKPYGGVNGFTAKGKDYARKAVRFERRLELAMEGHRFFDLQRWDVAEPGYMASLLNTYMQKEVAKFEFYLPDPLTYDILKNKTFVKGKHEIYAIPQVQIDQSADAAGPTLIQNPNHN
ncbi:MAG: RagB/SusD family nutrient uptake outer membrane protein, partial [Saprospiraceae bacterium]|nr:RagB/SusD family nutrient uptake outer membrane protein [Saprospiraceae bacterium]